MYIAFTSTKKKAEEITDYLVRVVQPQLGTLPGVAEATIFGKRRYVMRVWLNPEKMAAHNVTASDVRQALMQNNVQSAAGRIEGQLQEFNVTAATDLRTADQFNGLVLKSDNNQMIRLRDVGRAVLGTANKRASAIINGKKRRGHGHYFKIQCQSTRCVYGDRARVSHDEKTISARSKRHHFMGRIQIHQ